MTDADREELVAEVTSAWRPPVPGGGVHGHPAWHDLDAAGRLEAFDRADQLRVMEAALDQDGISSTGRAVLARILRG